MCAFPIILLFLKYPHGKAGRRIDRETVIMVKRRGLDDHGVFRRVQHSAGIYIKNNFAEFSTLSIQREKRPKNKGALLIGDGISDGDTLVSDSGELVHIATFEFE